MKIFLEWFKNWKPIHLCWLLKRFSLPIPSYLIGAGSPFTLSGSRIANATRTWQANEDTSKTDWVKTNDFIFAIASESGAHSSATGTLQIRWRNKTDGGSFALLSDSGELTWSGVTDLVNDNAVTSGEAGCTSPDRTWDTDNGTEREGANDTATDLANDEWTEHHWAIDCSSAHDGDEYEFELYDSTEGAAVGTCLATITMESAGVTVSPTPASAVAVGLIGAIVLGSISLTPATVNAVSTTINPTVVLGSSSVTPNPVESVSITVNPTVIKGSLILSPSPVEAVGAAIDPTVVIGGGELVTPNPVTAVSTTVNPTVILGNSSVTPSSVSAIAGAIDPTVVQGETATNNLNHNPMIIDTVMTEAEITRDVYITGFYWTGLSDGDTVSVKDNCATPKQIWKAEASANGVDVQFKPQQPIPANGIFVDDIPGSQSSMLLIYLTSRI